MRAARAPMACAELNPHAQPPHDASASSTPSSLANLGREAHVPQSACNTSMDQAMCTRKDGSGGARQMLHVEDDAIEEDVEEEVGRGVQWERLPLPP